VGTRFPPPSQSATRWSCAERDASGLRAWEAVPSSQVQGELPAVDHRQRRERAGVAREALRAVDRGGHSFRAAGKGERVQRLVTGRPWKLQPSVETAAAVASVEADITIVGIGGGSLPVGFGLLPYEASVTTPYWGSRSEFHEVLELARAGAISVHTETCPLDEAPEAYARLHNGHINGRAVIVPNA
jgi:threonine dehydrogenase-like Zn-dependent dehydrogenase